MKNKILNFIYTLGVEYFFRKLLFASLKLLNKKSGSYFTYLERPKKLSYTHPLISNPSVINAAIIIQGPIITQDNFTYETIKYYKFYNPTLIIILSTWKDYPKELIASFSSLGIVVIENERPQLNGPLNINLQIFSTLAGINYAINNNIEYVIKTRSDQRLYSPLFLNAFKFLDFFPISANKSLLKKRIITSTMSTLKYRPYGLSDMFMMGTADDLKKYWSIELDIRNKVSSASTVKEYAKDRFAETYIMSQFAEKCFDELDYSLRQTWELYNDYFIILDKSLFDIFWLKYNFEKENRLPNYNFSIYNEMKTLDWIALSEIEKLNIPEHVIEFNMESYEP